MVRGEATKEEIRKVFQWNLYKHKNHGNWEKNFDAKLSEKQTNE